MFLNDLFFALLITLLLTVVFTGLLRTRGPWSSIPLFFIVLFLTTWAGGVWLSPAVPLGWSGRWLPFLVVGLIVSLLLAAVVVVEEEPINGSTVELVDIKKKKKERKAILTTLSVFFWVLLAVLLVTIIVRYI